MQISIPVGKVILPGILSLSNNAKGIVLFAHGSGSSRLSPRNQYVAQCLNEAGIATLLFDLLTPEEEMVDEATREHRFNISLLTSRLAGATCYAMKNKTTKRLPIGYFGASTGAAAALSASVYFPHHIKAIVSRGGRPDLAGEDLAKVTTSTLFIVGGADYEVIQLNKEAMRQMAALNELRLVPSATHLFEEEGALEAVATLAIEWFLQHLE